jgi:hypothetical protein
MRRLIPLALGCILFVLPAQGATLTFGLPTVEPAVLMPRESPAVLTLPVSYVCQPTETRIGTTTLTLDAPKTDPGVAGIVVAGPKEVPIPETACQGPASKRWDGEVTFTVTADEGAPGERPLKVSLHGGVAKDSAVAAAEATATATATVAWTGMLEVKAPRQVQEAGPQKPIVYELEVANLGNALTTVTFEVRGGSPGWQPTPPSPVVLEAMQAGGALTKKTVSFVVSTPHQEGWNSNETVFQLVATPHSTRDSAVLGPSIEASFLARVRGLYCSGESTPECKEAMAELRKECADQQGSTRAIETSTNHKPCDQLLAPDSKGSPAAGLPLAVALMGVAIVLRRRA